MGKIVFITGTDTGVGKTVLTALLLSALQDEGIKTAVMKPFSCGDRADARLFLKLQKGEVSIDQINPYHFKKPVAPLIAASPDSIRLKDVLKTIRRARNPADILLVEGCGGLLVPLGPGYSIGDLIKSLRPSVIVVGRNSLGTINHTLLTVKWLQQNRVTLLGVVLMDQARRDESAKTNARTLSQFLKPVEVVVCPFLGQNASRASVLKKNLNKAKNTLAPLFKAGKLTAVERGLARSTAAKKCC